MLNVLKVLFDEAEVLSDKREMSDFQQQKIIKWVNNREYFKKLPKIKQNESFVSETKRK